MVKKERDSNFKKVCNDSQEKKNARIQFLLSSHDEEQVEKAAGKVFLDKSSFCRQAILSKTREVLS